MKKVFCLLLALACLFAVVSCGENTAELLFSLTGENTPTEIKTHVDYSVIRNNEEITLTGDFDTKMQGDDAIFEFEYQRFADPTKGELDDMNPTVKGKIITKDGKVQTEGGEWEATAPTALNYVVNLGALKEGSYQISEDQKTLTAMITGAGIKRVFGTQIPTSVVNLTVKSNGTSVTGMTVKYKTLNTRAEVKIDTSYSYNALDLFGQD